MATLVYLDHARAVTLGLEVELATVLEQATDYEEAYASLAVYGCYGEARVVPYVTTPQEALVGKASLVYPYGTRGMMPGDLVWMPELKQIWLHGPKGLLPVRRVKGVSFQRTKKKNNQAPFSLPKGVVFNVGATLNHLLMMTDINEDIPAFALRTPYPNVYFEFEHHNELVLEYEGKNHAVQALQMSERGSKHGMRVIVVVVRLFGNVDVPFPPILIDDDSKPALGMLVKQYGFDKLMKQIIKLLLYINGRSITEDEYHKLTPVRANRVRQTTFVLPAKPSKPIKIGMIREQIAIGNKPVNDDPEYAPISAHYRRGHLKMVRFGPGMQQRKVKWIMPTVVNFHLLGPGMTKEVALKMYKVTL